MATVVRVQVHNLDLDDESIFDRLADFEDATFSRVDDLAFITVYVEDGHSVVDSVLEATRKLSCKVPGAIAKRVHPDLVTSSDIAHRVGVSREAVRKWVNGATKAFPTQFDTVGADQRVWRWVEVVEWLMTAKAIDMDEDLPSLADIAHIDACLDKVPDVTSRAWQAASEIPFGMNLQASPAKRRDAAKVIDLDIHRQTRAATARSTSVG